MTAALVAVLATSSLPETVLAQAQEVCYHGFVMDQFCINRGRLLDNPSVVTLENPAAHSVHCLVDINRCVDSGYEVLELDANADEGQLHGRVLRVDGQGRDLLRDLARQVGRDCSTCPNRGDDGSVLKGFAASVIGTVQEATIDDEMAGIPPTMLVTDVRLEACDEAAGDVLYQPTFVSYAAGTEGTGISPVLLHGAFMMAAWGFFLPLGVVSAILRRRNDSMSNTWFLIHRGCNVAGVFLTVCGLAVAFAKFDNVFKDGMGPSYQHGSMGITVASLAVAQVINAFLRPHKPDAVEHEESADNVDAEKAAKEEEATTPSTAQKSTARLGWEIMHKFFGYCAFALAYPTMYFGTKVAGARQQSFEGAFYGTLVFVALWSAYLLYRNKKQG